MPRIALVATALLMVAGLAVALPPSYPRPAAEYGPEAYYGNGPHLYFDVHLDVAAFAGAWDCVLPFVSTMTPSVAMACAEVGWWWDADDDGNIQADEWQASCADGAIFAALTPSTGAWGSFGVVGPDGTGVTNGPIILTLEGCDPADGYFRSAGRVAFPGDVSRYDLSLTATVCATSPSGDSECLTDTDVY